MKSFKLSSLLLIGFIFLSACSTWTGSSKSDHCLRNRTALDIGSGTTKMQIATVDVCQRKIKALITKADFKIDFKEDLQSRPSKDFSSEVMQKAIKAFSEVAQQSQLHGIDPSQIRGVATAAFRDSANAKILLTQAEKDLGIRIRVISQAEEAELGVSSVKTQIENPNSDIFVWDIGGGSMQLTYQDLNQNVFEISEGQMASVSFKNEFIGKIKKKDSTKVKSPNPISKKEANEGLLYIQKFLQEHPISSSLLEKAKKSQVYGIGGVLTMSLPSQIRSQSQVIHLAEIQSALQRQLGKTDLELQSKYAATDVTNLILVMGFMKHLGIEKYTIAVANNTSGLLVEEKYWQ